jgi:hypothetical protein
MTAHNTDHSDESHIENGLPPTDFEHMDDSIRKRLIVEIFHNMGCMNNKVYYTKYDSNAECLDRDLKVLKGIEKNGTPKAKKSTIS